jgi:hypothetical protein
MSYSKIYKKRNYCTILTGKCSGFLCEDFRMNICPGVMWEVHDRDGSIIARQSPPKNYDFNIVEMTMQTIEEIHKSGYIKKDEVIQNLKDRFKIILSERMLKYYGTVGLIKPGIVTKILGIRGSVSIYLKKTPDLINLYDDLKKHYKLTFAKILEFSNILNFKDLDKLELYWEHYESHRPTLKGEIKRRYFKQSLIDVSGFEIFTILRATIELENMPASLEEITIPVVNIIKNDKGEFEIRVKFFKDPKEEVVFTKDGPIVV